MTISKKTRSKKEQEQIDTGVPDQEMKRKVLSFADTVDHAVTAAKDGSITWTEAFFEIKSRYIIDLEDMHL